MSDSSYQRVKKALAEAQARNESDADIIRTLVQVVPQETLKALYREAVLENRSDLSSAIEAAFLR